MAVTTNAPPPPPTLPAEVVPSPQLTVAEKSAGVASGFASVKFATGPLNGVPTRAAIVRPAALSGASVTFIENVALLFPLASLHVTLPL